MYWVHPINQSHQQFGEFNTLYKDLRKYPDRFYAYYRMTTEQFDYILTQIEHLIYKQNTNWWCSISVEEKLTICIRYLYLLSFKSIKHVYPTAPIITNLETVLCRDGYVLSMQVCIWVCYPEQQKRPHTHTHASVHLWPDLSFRDVVKYICTYPCLSSVISRKDMML